MESAQEQFRHRPWAEETPVVPVSLTELKAEELWK